MTESKYAIPETTDEAQNELLEIVRAGAKQFTGKCIEAGITPYVYKDGELYVHASGTLGLAQAATKEMLVNILSGKDSHETVALLTLTLRAMAEEGEKVTPKA